MAAHHGQRMTILRMVLCAVVAAAACGPASTLSRHEAGQRVPGDAVVLVGMAEFDPPLQPGKPAAVDPKGAMSHLLLGFTYAADTAVDLDSMSHGLDEWVQVLPGKVFAIRAPRRPMFLRVMNMYLGYYFTGRVHNVPHPEAEKKLEWIKCYGTHRIDPGADDQFVYIGTIRCNHDNGQPTATVVSDTLEELRAALVALIGEVPVATRLAVGVE